MTGASITPLGFSKVALAAGGTGGHLFPAEALAAELMSRGLEGMLVTDRRGGGFGQRLPAVTTRQISAGGIAGIGFSAKAKPQSAPPISGSGVGRRGVVRGRPTMAAAATARVRCETQPHRYQKPKGKRKRAIQTAFTATRSGDARRPGGTTRVQPSPTVTPRSPRTVPLRSTQSCEPCRRTRTSSGSPRRRSRSAP